MNSKMIVCTFRKLTLDCFQPDSFAVLNVVPVPVLLSIVTFLCCIFQSSGDMPDTIT